MFAKMTPQAAAKIQYGHDVCNKQYNHHQDPKDNLVIIAKICGDALSDPSTDNNLSESNGSGRDSLDESSVEAFRGRRPRLRRPAP